VRSYDNAVGLIISILVAGYLVYALVAPEKL
jgi:K+-transporting ATPase KdpF subunit